MVDVFAPFLADAAEEGKDVILSMLVVGLIFVGVAVVGDVGHWLRHRGKH
jgi:hypothetical protein